MSRTLKTRLIRGLLLAVYVVATTASSLLHDHCDSCGTHDGACTGHLATHHQAADHHHGHGHSHCHHHHSPPVVAQQQQASDDSSTPRRNPLADDNCAACRFVGLCSLPVAPLPVLVTHELAEQANLLEPRYEARSLDRAIQPRAPPRLG